MPHVEVKKKEQPGAFPAEDLHARAERFAGRVGFFVKDLATGAAYGRNEHQRFPTASVFKLPVMVAMFREAEAGRIDLHERRRLAPDISSHGTGVLSLTRETPELTLLDYCRLMIVVSDNMAADMLVRALGTERINAILDELDLHNTRVPMEIGRWHYAMAGMDCEPICRENDDRFTEIARSGGLDDQALPFTDSLENIVASPHDMVALLEQLYRGKLASPQATDRMMGMLKESTGGYLRVRLRPDIEVANKRGGSHRIKADAGILLLPSGPLIAAGFTLADPPDDKSGPKLLGEMTAMAVGAVAPEALCAE